MEQRILEILRKTLECPTVDETCSRENCDNWDSLHNLNLAVELEMEFNVSLEPDEIEQLCSFEDIVRIIKSKL